MTPGPIRFVTVPEVLRLHAILIEDQGGDPALRDAGLLESAISQPQQTMFGEYLHPDIVSMAAAYAFHICKNHPFIDGNKRAATAAMIKFLNDNGWSFVATADEAEPVILRLASGLMEKPELTEWLRTCAKAKPRLELREFFQRIRLSDLTQLAGGMDPVGRPREDVATAQEAMRAIPLAAELFDAANEIQRVAGENPTAEQQARFRQLVEMEALLGMLYRLAEDMGYEW